MIEMDRPELLERIIAVMPGHVYWVDLNCVYQGCNDQQARSAGLNSRKEIIGKRNADLPWNKNKPDLAAELDDANIKVMQEGKPLAIEEPAQFQDGSTGVFYSIKVPLKEPKTQKVVGMVGISLDITDKKRAEEKVEEMLIQKSDILSTIVNEMRSLFQGIRLNIDNVKSGNGDLKLLDDIADACSQKHLLLMYASDFAKLDIGRLELTFDQFDALSTIEKIVLEKYRKLHKNVDLFFNLKSGLKKYIINADHVHFTQAIELAIDEAIAATVDGYIEVSIESSKQQLYITICDTSPGMGEALLSELFSKKAYETSLWGKSISLTYSKKFIEAMSGTYVLKSREDEGTEIKITLPLVEKEDVSVDFVRGKIYLLDQTSQRVQAMRNNLAWLGKSNVTKLSKPALNHNEESIYIIDEGMVNDNIDFIKANKEKILVLKRQNNAIDLPQDVTVINKPVLPKGLPGVLSKLTTIRKILVVEDSDFLRDALFLSLSNAGYQVSLAKDGEEGVGMARPIYDVILMDVGLPKIDGIEAARRIREQLGDRCPPIAAFTGLTAQYDIDRVIDSGVFDKVIFKAKVHGAELLNYLDTVLSDQDTL